MPASSWTFESRLLPSYVKVSLFPFLSVIKARRPAEVKSHRVPSDRKRLKVLSAFFTSFEADRPLGDENRFEPRDVYRWREPSPSSKATAVAPDRDTLKVWVHPRPRGPLYACLEL